MVVSVVSPPSHGFLVLKRVLKAVDALASYAEARSNGLNMTDLRKRKIEEDKAGSMS